MPVQPARGNLRTPIFCDGLTNAMGATGGTPSPDAETVVPGDGADLVDPDLVDLGEPAPAGERYSFVFDGNAQTLDHVPVNEELVVTTCSAGIDHARINADFSDSARGDATTAMRSADHGPVIAYSAPRRQRRLRLRDPDSGAPGQHRIADPARQRRRGDAGPGCWQRPRCLPQPDRRRAVGTARANVTPSDAASAASFFAHTPAFAGAQRERLQARTARSTSLMQQRNSRSVACRIAAMHDGFPLRLL